MAKQRTLKKRSRKDMSLSLRTADGMPLIGLTHTVTDSYRRMISGAIHREELPGRLSIVSALPKEGVTFTTLALATTLANDLSAPVCAVDLNWQNPGLLMHMASGKRKKSKEPSTNTPDSPGLAGVLSGSASLDDVLVATELPNLSLLPAGDIPVVRHSSLVHSESLRNCIEELSNRFEYLVLDIPAILATSNAAPLASFGDACCMVVQQGVTPVNTVKEALDEVSHLPMLGVILNKIHLHTPGWVRRLLPQD